MLSCRAKFVLLRSVEVVRRVCVNVTPVQTFTLTSSSDRVFNIWRNLRRLLFLVQDLHKRVVICLQCFFLGHVIYFILIVTRHDRLSVFAHRARVNLLLTNDVEMQLAFRHELRVFTSANVGRVKKLAMD